MPRMLSRFRLQFGGPLLARGRFLSVPIFLGLVALLPFLAACSHYRLGTSGSAKFQNLHINLVASELVLPQARVLATSRLQEAFLKDGRVSLIEDPARADAILQVTLHKYDREAVVARADDAGLARKFTLRLTAHCSLRTRDGQTLLQDRPVRVQRDAYLDAGQLLAEREALPLLLDRLAQEVLHLALDSW